jgi:hypothetical protein
VTDYTAPNVRYLAGFRSVPAARVRSEPTASAVAAGLSPKGGLIVALLLSLGIWGSMWLAASSLAAAWFR